MPDLPFAVTLNRAGPSPMHLQLAAQLREAALAGQLLPGSLLPGTRTLARDLGVTRGVVEAAYALLSADGTLEGEVGRGTRVSRGVGRTAQAAAPSPAWFAPRVPSPGMHSDERPGLHFRTGVTSAAMLNAQAWKRAWAYAARQPVGGGYADAAGLPELRAAVSAFVGRSRGLAATPDTLLLTAGTLQSLGLLARAVLPAGATVLFENPGYRAGRAVLEGAGLRLVPLPVDEDGPVVDNLPPAHAVYVTPSHQFPLGSRLSLPRRLALLAWAERQGALILEDDYDGEFRYDVPPLPPLASLDTAGRVVYLGTFSKVLSPALRTGFVMAAPALLAALSHERALTDGGHAPALQHALLHLLTSGEVDRHVRRARRWHAQVREALTAELSPLAPLATLRGIEAGLHVCLHLAPPLDAETVAQELAERGVYVETLRTFTFTEPPKNALVLGYGGLTVKEAQAGAQVIREVVEAYSAGRKKSR
ncbi:MocR-like pyridoxine biosynthesis transcription factor PdxR [Deinococcus sp. PESE-13]